MPPSFAIRVARKRIFQHNSPDERDPQTTIASRRHHGSPPPRDDRRRRGLRRPPRRRPRRADPRPRSRMRSVRRRRRADARGRRARAHPHRGHRRPRPRRTGLDYPEHSRRAARTQGDSAARAPRPRHPYRLRRVQHVARGRRQTRRRAGALLHHAPGLGLAARPRGPHHRAHRPARRGAAVRGRTLRGRRLTRHLRRPSAARPRRACPGSRRHAQAPRTARARATARAAARKPARRGTIPAAPDGRGGARARG